MGIASSATGMPTVAIQELVARFTDALLAKLADAERKHGWNDDWARTDWREICQRELLHHVEKGDPLDVTGFAAFCWHHGWPASEPAVDGAPPDDAKGLDRLCTIIADQAVPAYRSGKPFYSCTGYIAKRWQAAWHGACIALGGNPADYPDAWREVQPKADDALREALNKIADLGSCAHGSKRIGALFQEAINIAVGAL